MTLGGVGVGRRIAVVLFNLGGPDEPAAVRPFLRNLFADPAIIPAPAIVRLPLAALIAKAREESAIANYAVMGGGSPILPETQAQAAALERTLKTRWLRDDVKVVIAMRHWRPLTSDAARAVERFNPTDVVLCPLYPQFSTTTTGSSLTAWSREYGGAGETAGVCCWYGNDGLIEAHAQQIEQTWRNAGRPKVRLLFSAHGLPERTARSGDPYQWQVEATCAAIADRLGGGWDWQICYQSRVGPLKWIGPSTAEAIVGAARGGLGVLIDPVAFVSEHIETLVELDQDYAELAREAKAPAYLRAPAVGVLPSFINGMADAIERAVGERTIGPDGVACPRGFSRCGRQPKVEPV
jgi:ferrochelatase